MQKNNEQSYHVRLPRSDMGVSRMKSHSETTSPQLSTGENTPGSAASIEDEIPSNTLILNEISIRSDPGNNPPGSESIPKSEIIAENITEQEHNKDYSIPSLNICLLLYFGTSLVIIMLYLLVRGTWKGKMGELVNLLSHIISRNDAEL